MVRKEEGPRRWGGRDRAGAATAPMRPQACQQSATNPVGTSDRRRGVGRGRAMMDTTCLGEDGAERCSTGGRPCEQRRAHSPLTAFEEGRWPAGGSCSSDEIKGHHPITPSAAPPSSGLLLTPEHDTLPSRTVRQGKGRGRGAARECPARRTAGRPQIAESFSLQTGAVKVRHCPDRYDPHTT